jgi:glyoxylase-like metal-dependent hydrolase (beta-lactamase superfamily II)
MSDKPIYEIYALRYAGPLEGCQAMLTWNQGWDQTIKRSYYFWCLLGPGGPVLVDCGVAPQHVGERNLPGYESPAAVLERLGIKAEEVRHVFQTHLHWDHALGLGLFPQAMVHVHKIEYDFWLNDPVAQRPIFQAVFDPGVAQAVEQIKSQGRLHLVEADGEILPGLEALSAPGHTTGIMALSVNTAKGIAVMGSDCGHTFQNYAQEWPSVFICDLPVWVRSWDKLKAKVTSPELLFPGHDVAMSDNYPLVAPGVTRLV